MLPKPVFAALVIDARIQSVPIEQRERPLPGETNEPFAVSGVSNLSYVVLGGDTARELDFFQEIAPFSRLAVLYMEGLGEAVPDLDPKIRAAFSAPGVRVDPVAAGASVDEATANLPPDADAVFVAPLEHFSAGDRDRLAQALIERKLPSFSSVGRGEVERGLLATLWLERNLIRRARRVALNIQQVLSGANAGDLPVDFRRFESRAVNMATARAIVAMDLTRAAAETASCNLELVSERYAEGIVDILLLLDPQNQALATNLAAANTVFDYLTDLMGAQRAVGRFDYYRSPGDRDEFLRHLDEFFRESGYRARSR